MPTSGAEEDEADDEKKERMKRSGEHAGAK